MRRIQAVGLVFIGLLASPAGLRAADEAAALAWLKENGGKITRGDEKSGKPVVGVDLYVIGHSKVTNEGLKHPATLPKF